MSGFSDFLKSEGGAGAIEAGGGLLSGLISLFGPNPYKQQFKWSEKARAAKIKDIQSLMKPNAPWQNISGNMPQMNSALNSLIGKKAQMYGGISYPWMKQ
jgi:hypothetical protein